MSLSSNQPLVKTFANALDQMNLALWLNGSGYNLVMEILARIVATGLLASGLFCLWIAARSLKKHLAFKRLLDRHEIAAGLVDDTSDSYASGGKFTLIARYHFVDQGQRRYDRRIGVFVGAGEPRLSDKQQISVWFLPDNPEINSPEFLVRKDIATFRNNAIAMGLLGTVILALVGLLLYKT